jgi:hypothetical protein
MPLTIEIFPTTAEHIIAATDAVLTRPDGCDENYVAQFLDATQNNAHNALEMASQLGLITKNPHNLYVPEKPFAVYLSTAKDSQKAAVLRLVLENYEPYRAFKYRLTLTGFVPQAAEQVRVMFNLAAHRDEIKDTFVNLGTYAQSLISEGAGLFKPANFDTQQADFLQTVEQVAADRAYAEALVRTRLTDTVANWIDAQEVFSPLVTAYQLLPNINDATAPIVHAGNGVESFLVQLATHFGVDLNRANGINIKAERFSSAQLHTKHKNMLKYLGHLRNAADHGTDAEIGASWEMTKETATEYVHVSISTIKSIVLACSTLTCFSFCVQ